MKLFQAKPNVVDAEMGGDRALLDLNENTYFTLNPTAAVIWTAMSKPQPLARLVDKVTEEFEVTKEQCRPDIEALLQAMVAAKIVDEVEG